MAVGDVISSFGGAVGDLFKSEGNAAMARSYTGAAQLEQQNARLTKASTDIQEAQIARQVTQSLGTTQADIAGAGFTMSGSALDILRSSAQQGALAKSLTNIQGAINENSYAAMAGADFAKAKAANEANTAGTIQAIASIGGALVNNAGDLLKAGKSVVTGVESIFGASSSASNASFLAADGSINSGTGVADSFAAGLSGAPQTTGVAADFSSGLSGGSDLTSLSAGGANFESLSATDSAIADGSSIALDASGSSLLGSTVSEATSAVGSAFSAAGSAISAGIDGIFGAGSAAELGAFLGPAGIALAIASFIPGVGGVISSVENGIVKGVESVFHAIGDFFGF